MKPTALSTPALRTAPAAAAAWAWVTASGFSQITAFPACAAAEAISAWVPGGVQTSTTWTPGLATSSRQSVTQASNPYAAAARATFSGSRPLMTRSRGRHPSERMTGAAV